MSRIDSLTPAQEADLPAFSDRYFRLGTCTAPADRTRAESAFGRVYATIGRRPVPVVWVDSPVTASIFLSMADDPILWLTLGDSVRGRIVKSLGDNLSNSLQHRLVDSLTDSLGYSLRKRCLPLLGDNLSNSLQHRLVDSLGYSLRSNLWNSLVKTLGAGLVGNLRQSLGDSLGDSLRDSLRRSLADSLAGRFRRSLGGGVWEGTVQPEFTYWWGQHDLYWIALYRFCEHIGVTYDPNIRDCLDMHEEIGRSCMWWYPRDRLIVACERPLVVNMEAYGNHHRVHCPDGPAIAFRDGWKIFAWHGVVVPEAIIMRPGDITPAAVEAESNVEIRRAMIERIGIENYIATGGAILVHEDGFGALYRRDLGGGDLLAVVKVVNATTEPDGSRHVYFLQVEPDNRPLLAGGGFGAPQELTARNAVASTFGLRGEEYRPEVET